MGFGSFMGGFAGQLNKEREEVRLADIAEEKARVASERALSNNIKLMEATESVKKRMALEELERKIAHQQLLKDKFHKDQKATNTSLDPNRVYKGAGKNQVEIQKLNQGEPSVNENQEGQGVSGQPVSEINDNTSIIDKYAHTFSNFLDNPEEMAKVNALGQTDGYINMDKYATAFYSNKKDYNARNKIKTIAGQSMSQLNKWGMADEDMSAFINETTGELTDSAQQWNTDRENSIDMFGIERTAESFTGTLASMKQLMADKRIDPYAHIAPEQNFTTSKDDVKEASKLISETLGISGSYDQVSKQWVVGLGPVDTNKRIIANSLTQFFLAVGENTFDYNIKDLAQTSMNSLPITLELLRNPQGDNKELQQESFKELKSFYAQSANQVTDATTASAYESLRMSATQMITEPSMQKELQDLADKSLFDRVVADQVKTGGTSTIGRQLSKATRERIDGLMEQRVKEQEEERNALPTKMLKQLDEREEERNALPTKMLKQLDEEKRKSLLTPEERALEIDPTTAGIPTKMSGVGPATGGGTIQPLKRDVVDAVKFLTEGVGFPIDLLNEGFKKLGLPMPEVNPYGGVAASKAIEAKFGDGPSKKARIAKEIEQKNLIAVNLERLNSIDVPESIVESYRQAQEVSATDTESVTNFITDGIQSFIDAPELILKLGNTINETTLGALLAVHDGYGKLIKELKLEEFGKGTGPLDPAKMAELKAKSKEVTSIDEIETIVEDLQRVGASPGMLTSVVAKSMETFVDVKEGLKFANIWSSLYQTENNPIKYGKYLYDVARFSDGSAPEEEGIARESLAAAGAFVKDFKAIDPSLDLNKVTTLLKHTAYHESNGGEFDEQMGGGPARGWWQVEPTTARDLISLTGTDGMPKQNLIGPLAEGVMGYKADELRAMSDEDFAEVLKVPGVSAVFAASKYATAMLNQKQQNK